MAGDGWLKVKLIMEVVEMTFRTVIFIYKKKMYN